MGAERYNLFTECPQAKTATMVLRGGSDQFIDEAERSLHDAIMIVRRALKNSEILAGGGAIDMELSKALRAHARDMTDKVRRLSPVSNLVTDRTLLISDFGFHVIFSKDPVYNIRGAHARDMTDKVRRLSSVTGDSPHSG